MISLRTIRHRLAQWNSLSKGEQSNHIIMESRHRALFEQIDGRKGVPVRQSLLRSATNNARVRPRLLDKAARMGARPNEACDDRGSLAMSFYARHGESAYDADLLVLRGFDPLAMDAHGTAFAHHCFEFHNQTMSAWIMRRFPQGLAHRDDHGLSPMDYACSVPGRWHSGDGGDAFRDWALDELPADARDDFLAHAWLGAARFLKVATRYADVEWGLAWLSKLGTKAKASDGATILRLLSECATNIAEIGAPHIMAAIAATEREALAHSTPSQPLPARRTSIRV